MAIDDQRTLENATFKCIMVDGRPKIQLEWDDQFPIHGPSRQTTRRATSTKVGYTSAENDLIRRLKDERLPWNEIYRRYSETFERKRSLTTLQTRYYRELRDR